MLQDTNRNSASICQHCKCGGTLSHAGQVQRPSQNPEEKPRMRESYKCTVRQVGGGEGPHKVRERGGGRGVNARYAKSFHLSPGRGTTGGAYASNYRRTASPCSSPGSSNLSGTSKRVLWVWKGDMTPRTMLGTIASVTPRLSTGVCTSFSAHFILQTRSICFIWRQYE